MNESFQLRALSAADFENLFALSDADLAARNGRRMVVTKKPDVPCRISLADAEVGETVVLIEHTHHDVASPYRASGPVFIRRGVDTARPAPGEIPSMFSHRLLSLRAYDRHAMMVGASTVDGTDLAAELRRLFGDRLVEYIHLHNAGPGCYNCTAVRATKR